MTVIEPLAATSRASKNDVPAHCGILIVDKPTGVTSHDVVDVVRRRFREKRAGHLGTLDPGASGLLALALGPATRCVPVWQGGEKTYQGTIRFGVVTSTQDLAGEVLAEHAVTLTEGQVREASAKFIGSTQQVPPMVSAIRVRGERLYRLARRGITVEREPRPVLVRSWEWLSFDLPEATFQVRCSGGTYVRTLAHDLGAGLGCGAALASLRRLRSEPFDLSRSVTLRDLHEFASDEAWRRGGIGLDEALEVLPGLRLTREEAERLGRGSALPVEQARTAGLPIDAGPRSIVFRDPEGNALALGEVSGSEDRSCLVQPHVVFPWALRQGHV